MFRRKGQKLSRFLGQLEADIMEILWRQSPLSAKEIRLQLRLKKKLATTTVLTVLARLVEKEHLIKTPVGRSSAFTPVKDMDTFVHDHISEIVAALRDEFPVQTKKALGK